MSNWWKVKDEALTATASKIMEKLGSSTQVQWNDTTGYTAAVDAISGSSGGGVFEISPMKTWETELDLLKKNDIHNSSVNYGNSIHRNLFRTVDYSCAGLMSQGWESGEYYNAESLIGAYEGFEFDSPHSIDTVRFYLGRYSGQNKTLIATAEYKNSLGEWVEFGDMDITTGLSYPVNYFDMPVPVSEVYGIRWIHKKGEVKSGGNNLTYFGMEFYANEVLIQLPESIIAPRDCLKSDDSYSKYITTDILVTSNQKLTVLGGFTDSGTTANRNSDLFGATAWNTAPGICWASSSFVMIRPGGETYVSNAIQSFTKNKIQLFEFDPVDGYLSIDKRRTNAEYAGYDSTGELIFFAGRDGNSFKYANAEIYYVLIEDITTGNKVHELIPCRLLVENDVIGCFFYDTVAKRMYSSPITDAIYYVDKSEES